MNYYLVLLFSLVFFLISYLLGYYHGHSQGIRESKNYLPLELRRQALLTGKCRICDTSFAANKEIFRDDEIC